MHSGVAHGFIAGVPPQFGPVVEAIDEAISSIRPALTCAIKWKQLTYARDGRRAGSGREPTGR
jgi:hypothetical protein